MPSTRALVGLGLLLLVAACAGPATTRPGAPVDPALTLSARETQRGLVFDRLPSGGSGMLVPAGRLRLANDPAYVFQTTTGTIATLWEGPQEVTVRRGPKPDSPLIGRVVTGWQNQSVRLLIESTTGPTLATEVFTRQSGAGASTLTRAPKRMEPVRGTFRSPVRTGDGSSVVGWLAVTVTPDGAMSLAGVLPASVPDPLAAAAGAVLESEVYWIEAKTAAGGS